MRSYETIFVINPEKDMDSVKDMISKVKNIIENDGQIESIEEWGKKKLAYIINKKFTDGFYVLINFKANANSEALPQLEHHYKISEDIIRHIVVKKED